MLVAAGGAQSFELGANAARLIGAELLRNGKMEGQVKERVRLAALGLPIAFHVALRVLDDRMIFGMQRDGFHRHRFERGEQLVRTVFRPRVDEEATRFIA